MSTSSSNDNSFVDLTSYETVRTKAQRINSSIIKSTSVKDAGVARIEIIDGDQASPRIQIQREGDRIKQIEFVCPCGKSAHLDLEYDEE
ncbi:MAG TPA: hypothetical protein VMH23_18215 [Bacteroidota bacterium]|nr:hypothetical protein [Bacteroidota bacterium]